MRLASGIALVAVVFLVPGCAVDTVVIDGGSPDGGSPDVGARDDAAADASRPNDAASVEDAAPPEPCAMAGVVEHVPCGQCGTLDRLCTSAGTWAYGVCTGEHGVCTPGATSVGSCGRCGQQARFCEATCEWLGMGACIGETGSCTPGTTTRVTTGCAAGESRLQTCTDACTTTDGPCEMLECTAGMTMTVSCGMCGMRVRTCDATNHWVDGACTAEGACMPGALMTGVCQVCGTQPSTCDAACHWQPSGACVGGVTCPARPADTCLDAMTRRSYARVPMCVASACVYAQSDVTCAAGCVMGACVGGATLLAGLGGATDFGTTSLGSSDDGSSPAIDVSALGATGLLYYGSRFTTLFVNNNGNVTFGAAQMAFTPMLPGSTVPMIAPFWADVDTRAGGQPAHDNVVWHVDATRFVATWHLVGYYAMHNDRENSFQVIVTPRPDRVDGDFDVELRYAQCQWSSGDTSGIATAGFDAGDHSRFLALPGSGTAAVLDLCVTSNVGSAGIWRFEVRNGLPVSL